MHRIDTDNMSGPALFIDGGSGKEVEVSDNFPPDTFYYGTQLYLGVEDGTDFACASLSREQAAALHEYLGHWLERTGPFEEGS